MTELKKIRPSSMSSIPISWRWSSLHHTAWIHHRAVWGYLGKTIYNKNKWKRKLEPLKWLYSIPHFKRVDDCTSERRCHTWVTEDITTELHALMFSFRAYYTCSVLSKQHVTWVPFLHTSRLLCRLFLGSPSPMLINQEDSIAYRLEFAWSLLLLLLFK